jgi:dTMP kinase
MLDALERAAVGETRPDLTIILDVPAAIGLARAARRMVATGTVADRFERDDLAIHEARRQAFLAIAAAEPERCVVVDATRSDAETASAVWQATANRLLVRTD